MAGKSPRYKKRKDNNHPDIVAELQSVGMVVLDCAAKGFYTDLLLGWRGVWAFIEVKNPDALSKKQKQERELSLTDTENGLREICYRNDLPFRIVLSSEEAIEYMHELTRS